MDSQKLQNSNETNQILLTEIVSSIDRVAEADGLDLDCQETARHAAELYLKLSMSSLSPLAEGAADASSQFVDVK